MTTFVEYKQSKITTMKKALFMLVVMMTMTVGVFAQGNGNNGNNQLINKARQAAQAAGCLDSWNGQVDAQVTVISACFVSGFITEVLIIPVCHGPECEFVRLGALAIVTMGCDDEVLSVECIGGN
ncbi:MAG: hypothetical protein ACI837_000679 [Crocinitomicaceae bacterium]